MTVFNHISIVSSTRNSAQYIERSLGSAISQDYPDFEIIFLDAESTDGTYEKALAFKERFDRLSVFRNERRKYQGENVRIGVQLSPPGSIIVTLDGDDWLAHDGVLKRVNREYVDHDCWMTYGTYEKYPEEKTPPGVLEYPLEVRENRTFRSHRWLGSHLRTFRRELFLKVDPEDMKDPRTGDFVSMAPDLSFQFPMLEMCGAHRSRHIPEVLYMYNMENPLSESKIDKKEIRRIDRLLRSKQPYEPLDALD